MARDKKSVYYYGYSFIERIEVLLDGTQEQQIRQDMPDQIDFIYGVSTQVGGVTPGNAVVIFPGEDALLFLNLKQNATDLWDQYRMDNLVFTTASEQKWVPAKLPGKIDMDRSSIVNPTGIVDRTVVIELWYIPHGYMADDNDMSQIGQRMRIMPGPVTRDGGYRGMLISPTALVTDTPQGKKVLICTEGAWIKNPNTGSYYCSGKVAEIDV